MSSQLVLYGQYLLFQNDVGIPIMGNSLCHVEWEMH